LNPTTEDISSGENTSSESGEILNPITSTTFNPTSERDFSTESTTLKTGVSYESTTVQITTNESPKDAGGISTASTSRSTFTTESPESLHSSTQPDLFNQFSTSGSPEITSTTEFRPSVTTESAPNLSSQTMISQFESSTSQQENTTAIPLSTTTLVASPENQTESIKNDNVKPEIPPFETDLFDNSPLSTTEFHVLTSTANSVDSEVSTDFDFLTTPAASSEEVTQGDEDDRFDNSPGGGCDSDNDCPDYEACKENICVNPCLKPRAACALNARCSVANHTVQCSCPPGQLGDAHVDCRRGITHN